MKPARAAAEPDDDGYLAACLVPVFRYGHDSAGDMIGEDGPWLASQAKYGPDQRRVASRSAARPGDTGAIITAALLATAGDELHTSGLVVAVLATLVVYWLAGEYVELLGEQVAGGMVPTWDYVREALAETWPVVVRPPSLLGRRPRNRLST